MTHRSTAAWAAALVVTALVVGVGTWFVTDRDRTGDAGDAAAVEQAGGVTASAADATPSWLFSETAGGGTYAEHADGTATLTLTDVDADVTGFTDRPDRDTVVFPAAKLVEAWPTLFADSPPNAVLVTRDSSGAASSYVLTLTDPSVDGSTMTFTAAIVQGKDHSSQLPGMTQAPSTRPQASFRAVSLFIDDVNPSSGSFKCVNGSGQVITPPGTYPVIYKPVAPFVALCSDAGGTVTPKPPS
jgi:hypothetical protein